MRDVLDEVVERFPSPYIHVGADETVPDTWRRCSTCNSRMKELLQKPLPPDVTAVRLHVLPYEEDPARGAGVPFQADISLGLGHKRKNWLGWQDSNLRMAGSKPAALPLGDTPTDQPIDVS